MRLEESIDPGMLFDTRSRINHKEYFLFTTIDGSDGVGRCICTSVIRKLFARNTKFNKCFELLDFGSTAVFK